MPKSSTDKKLEVLIQAVEKLVASPIAPVAPIAPILPIAPIAPIAAINTGDHDFLLDFSATTKVKLDNIFEAITKLSDGTTSKINALEVRTETNANDILVMQTQIKVWGISLGVGWTILIIVLKFFKVI